MSGTFQTWTLSDGVVIFQAPVDSTSPRLSENPVSRGEAGSHLFSSFCFFFFTFSCRILVPRPGVELFPPVEAQWKPIGPPGKFLPFGLVSHLFIKNPTGKRQSCSFILSSSSCPVAGCVGQIPNKTCTRYIFFFTHIKFAL